MSNASFRLESFRPWNPFQDKAQPLRDSLDICRYPSPVSMTPTPPPSNPVDPVSKSQNLHAHEPGRHPLPARPPLEVCMDDGLHSDAQPTRHEPENLSFTTLTSPHAETFDSEDVLQLQDLPSTEDIDSAPIPDNGCLGAEHRSPGFESSDLDPGVIVGQHAQALGSSNHIRTGDLLGNEAIDPAILSDHGCPDSEHIQATDNITSVATHLDECPSNCSRFPNRDPSFQRSGHNTKETVDHDRQSSKVQKFSPTGKRKANNSSSRPTRGPGRGKNGSFPAVRAQFSALSVEDRLQFLSWLFEGALSHCVSTRANTDATSGSRSIPSQHVDISYDYPSSNTQLVDTQSTPTRKGLPTPHYEDKIGSQDSKQPPQKGSRARKTTGPSRLLSKDDKLLIELKEERSLPWKRIAEYFPGKSEGSLQVRYCTRLKGRKAGNSGHSGQSSNVSGSSYRGAPCEAVQAVGGKTKGIEGVSRPRYGPPRRRQTVDRYSPV
ncbi:hypothetical protein N7537_011469 [Penicillium hordei]|uniref:Myb-like domain-containing protein n=1 Tax=Penicillium hordei TaxID=40994 RepID=A0AAD6DLW0_9EURO|nr:uncharacterized protein N7537_011469 [Penicillium hordei]KAJ5588791.1 hypothetical protein N7537_011469 [Penicillium hordei]